MKINVNSIPIEGIDLEEEISYSELDLDTEVVRVLSPIRVKARITKITNTVTIDLSLNLKLHLVCSRCLKKLERYIHKDLRFTYQVEKVNQIIDLNQDIRQEVILDYPLKPLCSPTCKGLCASCGKDLNEGDCDCHLKNT
ncbi:MAG: DUF177 domain-containing protein [Candidatus Omnitrophica bacterium]|nr:DUF177 domain-containing protein [Candidatus Omnitrophota bacterium]